jgi:hypothetical protein
MGIVENVGREGTGKWRVKEELGGFGWPLLRRPTDSEEEVEERRNGQVL